MEFKIPHISSDPEYAEARRQEGRIAAALKRTTEEIERLRERRPTPDIDVETLLAGGDDVTPENSPSLWRERMMQLSERANRLEAAFKQAVSTTRNVAQGASERIASQVKPQYREIQQRICDALIPVGEAADEEAAFQRALSEAGVQPGHIGANSTFKLRGTTPPGQWSEVTAFLHHAEKLHGVKPRGAK